MKTTAEKTFDAVKFMREQREKLSERLSKMTKEEIVEYFRREKLKSSIKPCA
jgi:c-di-AMP phosphodiesterase-like protein